MKKLKLGNSGLRRSLALGGNVFGDPTNHTFKILDASRRGATNGYLLPWVPGKKA